MFPNWDNSSLHTDLALTRLSICAMLPSMRVLAISDVHGVSAVYDWLIRWSRVGVDAVVLAGDLLTADFEEKQRKAAEELVTKLHCIPAPVLYIMGNDDNVSLDCDDPHLIPLHGRTVEIDGISFVGYHFTPPFVGYRFVKPEADIARELQQYDRLIGTNTVLVTHSPAFGYCDVSFGESCGSPAITALLQRRPALAHIHGHIHHHFGRAGNHFNVASAGLCRAMILDLPAVKHCVISVAANLVWTRLP